MDEQDDFAAAFAHLTDKGELPPADPAPAAPAAEATPAPEPGKPSGGSEPTAAPAATAAPATPTAETPAATPSSEPEGTPAASAAPPASAVDPRIADLERQLEEARAQAKPATPAPATPDPAAAPATPDMQLPDAQFSDDERKAVEDYLKDWPEVARAESLMRRQEYTHIVNYVFGQVRSLRDAFQERIDALEQFAEPVAHDAQYGALVKLIPDYDKIRDPVLAWIDQQPAAIKAGFQEVASNGTPQDIAAMVSIYRQATGTPAPAAPAASSTPPAPVAASKAPAGNPAAAAAAAALKPVATARSAQEAATPDANDFDSAFAEFAKL